MEVAAAAAAVAAAEKAEEAVVRGGSERYMGSDAPKTPAEVTTTVQGTLYGGRRRPLGKLRHLLRKKNTDTTCKQTQHKRNNSLGETKR